MTDPQASILTAIALIDRSHDPATLTLLPEASDEALALMGSLAGCGNFLAGALAGQMGIDRADVIEALRHTMTEIEMKGNPDE